MTNDALLNALSQLVSEGRNPETMDIDLLVIATDSSAHESTRCPSASCGRKGHSRHCAGGRRHQLRPLNKVVDYCIWVLAPAAD